MLERGERVSRLLGEVAELEERRKLVMAELREQVKEVRAEYNEAARECRERAAYREVDVVERRASGVDLVEVVRSDTGEIVRTRPLTHVDLQVELLPASEDDGAA